MTRPNVICDSCGQVLKAGDAFCETCGAEVSEVKTTELQEHVRTARSSRAGYRGRRAARSRADKVAKAGVWLMVLAVIFAIFGTIYGFKAKSDVEDVERALSTYDDSHRLTLEGETKTVAEVRKAMHTEVTLLFVTNYLLAAIYVGLFFWAKKKPFPAFVTALCIFVVVHLANAVVDPTTIVKGIIVKVFALIALVGGIKAALDQRAAREDYEARSAARRQA